MKLIIFVLIFVGYVIAYSQPRIQIEGNGVCDWGKVNPKGKPLSAKVKIFNKGTQTLKISEVKPGCGCTTAPLDKNVIEPNGFATLSISFKVDNDGPVQKSVRIYSNDPKTPTKELVLKADIIRPVSLSQRNIVLSNMTINKESASKITIKNNSKKAIKIISVITEPKELKTSIKKNTIIPPGNVLPLEVKYTPKNGSYLTGKVTLKTDNKEMGNIEINVAGNVAQTMFR